jgi:hypothetical protein
MPYFHVQITHNQTKEFVVNAANQTEAEDIALAADAAGKCDNKKIVPLDAHNSATVSSSTATKSAWTETLKQQKDK